MSNIHAQNSDFLFMVGQAIKAPSGHNTQPWLFKINESSIEIHPNLDKALPIVDFDNRELFITLGCAAENICITASCKGYESAVSINESGSIVINLIKQDSIEPNPLFEQIAVRQTNRSVYNGSMISEDTVSILKSIDIESDISIYFYENGTQEFESIAGYVFRGNQSDGYGAYGIYEKKENVLLSGCWAHARRKFEQALKEDPPGAEYALQQTGRLYQLERQMSEENLSKGQIEELRKKEAYPILKDFEKWMDLNYPYVLPKSLIGKAMSYACGIYQRLARYVLDGRYRIDNNLAENAVRPMALGRKNYLFCLNHQAAERTAMIYSLLGTCKICGVP